MKAPASPPAVIDRQGSSRRATDIAAAQLRPLLQYIRKISRPALEPTDSELLERFGRRGDEAAFAALVARHGPMVLGVCRRVLRDAHDAEDAFQATFLLLVRKAGSLRQPDQLSPWLYGVAYRTAIKARACAARRRECERPVAVEPVAAAPAAGDMIWRELRPVLDEAVHRLPAKYRAPVVLCYLEGRTNVQAARQLGVPVGTVATRLARAREMLRRHLTRRGVTVPLALLGTAWAEQGPQLPVSRCRLTPSLIRS